MSKLTIERRELSDEELKRVRIAGKIARVLRYFLYLVTACLLALAGFVLYILFTGGN